MVSDMTDSHHSGFRVMMFRLSNNKQWDVFGVGYLQRLIPGQNPPAFIIDCEQTDKRLIYHRISKDTEYVKQNDSIIVFYDSEHNMDLAISFQHADACQSVWEQVQAAASSASPHNISLGPNCVLLDDHDINVVRESDEHEHVSGHTELVLSTPTIDNLEKVLDEIQNIHPAQKDDLAPILRSTTFISTLFDTFEQAKDLEAFDALFALFAIVKSLFFLNSVSVIEMLTGIDTIRTTIDILEYNPSLARLSLKDPPEISYNKYRKALESSQFRNVVPIENNAIVQSIQRNYYISFIRDVIFLRYLNDNVTQTLNSLVFCNMSNIVTPLLADAEFHDRLFTKLSGIPLLMPAVNADHVDILRFINELVTLVKTMPVRPEFYSRLCQRGLLKHLADILYAWQENVPQPQLALHGAAHVIFEILHTIVLLDPQLIRAAMLSEGASSKLVMGLFGIITNKNPDISAGIQYQASELLITLLHTESIEFCNQKSFVECCLESHLNTLCQCIKDRDSVHNSIVTSASVLTSLIRDHGSALEFTFKHIRWTDAALRLLSELANTQLILLGVRMVRAAFVQLFNSHSNLDSKSDAQILLKACIDVFLYNGPHRYNLLHSAILDLVEYIRAQNIKPLVSYLVEFELPRLQPAFSLPIFQELRVRAEQNRQGDDTVKSGLPSDIKDHSQSFNEMQQEEQYFDSISNDTPNQDTDVVMDDLQSTFIERKEMQPKEEQVDFVSTIQRRKKLKVGARPSISIKKLVNYPIEDDEKDSQANERRNNRTGSYENAGTDISLDHSDVQSVQCEPVSQQS